MTSKGKETDPLLKGEGSTNGIRQVQDLIKTLGVHFLASMFLIKHLFISIVNNMATNTTAYIYRWYGVSGPQLQLYQTLTCFPLALQPIICLLSDCVPIRGQNKAPYMILATLVGAPAFLAVGTLTPEVLGVTGLVICLLMIKLQVSTCNVLVDSTSMMKIAEHPAHGPDIVTFMKMGVLGFGFAGTILSGIIVQLAGARATYVCSFPLALTVLVPLCLGWLGERKHTEEETRKLRARLGEQPEICMLAFTVCGGALLLTSVGIITSSALLCSIIATGVAVVLLVSYALFLQPIVAKFLTYVLITHAFDVSTSGAAYYFYTDTLEQFPEGPHFSPFFFVTSMHIVSISFGILGTMWYLRYLRSWTYRRLIVLTVVVKATCRGMDALLFSLASRKIGIPDTALVLTEEVIGPILDAWRGMPIAILLANVCPKGMTGTMNGLNASAIYIGESAAKCFGALLLQHLGCRPGGKPSESHEFDKLWIASVVSMVLSVVAGVGLIGLIPSARQDAVLSDVQASAGTPPH